MENRIRLLKALVTEMGQRIEKLTKENAELKQTLEQQQEEIVSLRMKSEYAVLKIDEIIERLKQAQQAG